MQEEEQRSALSRRFKKIEEERIAKRQLEKSPLRRVIKTPSPSLCRALFPCPTRRDSSGLSHRDECINEARRYLREIAEEQKKRWNFDFDTETPLPGRWQWEKVERPNPPVHRNVLKTVWKPMRPLRPRQANEIPPTAVQSKITDFLKQRRAASGNTFESDQCKMEVTESFDAESAENNSKTEAQ